MTHGPGSIASGIDRLIGYLDNIITVINRRSLAAAAFRGRMTLIRYPVES